jgi:hypothetical protein
VEVFDLADTDPEERLLQEVCCVYLCVVEWQKQEEESVCHSGSYLFYLF